MSELHTGITTIANTLEGLDRPIDKSEDWCVYSIVNLFDPVTRDKWAEKVTLSRDPPSFASLKEFLCNQLHQLEVSQIPAVKNSSQNQQPKAQIGAGRTTSKGVQRATCNNLTQKTKKRYNCVLCSKEHFIMHCPEYKRLSAEERKTRVNTHQLCTNCLGQHLNTECPSSRGCYLCGENHHTSLHESFKERLTPQKTVHHVQDCSRVTGKVLLATALVNVNDKYGRRQTARALIDQGSEISMMSEGLAQRLQLPRSVSQVDIYGVGGQQLARARGRVTLTISSSKTDDVFKVSAVILTRLTTYTHDRNMLSQSWNHLQGLELADPNPTDTRPIDVFLGADAYPALIKEGIKRGNAREPMGQLTIFGWILIGLNGPTAGANQAQVHQITTTGDSLSSLVRKFWEQEDIPETATSWTTEEQECENHYISTHSRTPEGRYQVRLPFKSSGPISSGSRLSSLQSLRRMEQRFRRDGTFKELYCDFIQQYEELKHMSVADDSPATSRVHYLPHHGVLKPTSTTTKLRVVFNGSWSEAGQLSLNDCLHSGPNPLPLLADVLLRWRRHQYVVTADVTKMYRQILMHPEDRGFQRILWRPTEERTVKEYRLNTVTYGLSCAPYLAIRTLRQLADDENDHYPIGAQALRQDAYVDDILTGADNLDGLAEVTTQLHQLCKAGGFPLQKWASNAHNLSQFLQQEIRDSITLPNNSQNFRKTWTDKTQYALFTITDDKGEKLTKRGIVSKAAQIFDPLGWLTPVTVRAKITIQSTWLLGLDWDDPLPATLAGEWKAFCDELKMLEQIRINRSLFHDAHQIQKEIHGFADVSERAYGAVLYLRTKGKGHQWHSTLITAKSKVAPLHQVSLPRLELCVAHLLARLTQKTLSTLNINVNAVHPWSDSMVAIGWIQAHPSRWNTYVANRVAEIQRRILEAQWHHIAGASNPADCASRGLSPSQLLGWTLWWKGPDFLHKDNHWKPLATVIPETLPEERGPISAVANVKGEENNSFLKDFSNYSRLLRVTAWCRRWLTRRRRVNSPSDITPMSLSVTEVEEAETCWLRIVQESAFREEIGLIRRGKGIPPRNSLSSLVPILDDKGILRVKGRLREASLNPDEAHPIILPPESHYTYLIVVSSHERVMHGGVQSTLGAIRQRYWIPRGRSIVKGVIHKCVVCLRWRAAPAQQLMGELPRPRVTPARPFLSSGVDYAGPIWLRTSPGRGHKAFKAFLAVFVCMVTKAVHLEVVSDYSAKAFIAAFRRFISRRGLCTHLYSDCGTTFKGADHELRRLFSASCKENSSIRSQLCELRTQWHFNPPGVPHCGGLWEAAVKSAKHHLRRTIGETRLTFEEMTTLLAEVEACLNSRPLAPLSDDPDDFTALTPGHFLIGSALNSIPEPSLLKENESYLNRWKLVTKMRDHFWVRWHREYLQGLTIRPKWRSTQENIAPGHLCLIIGESLPPSQWPLARLTKIYPGKDDKVRVVKVVTATSEYVRPIHKLILLPIHEENSLKISSAPAQ